jgi:MoxR-like ATPase
VVLLIDEIDKADIEFPNDLLLELDRMEFHVYETGATVRARQRPIVVITSNNEKELPDAFLRRCFFHFISFPDRETMARIVEVHYPGIKRSLVNEALDIFFDVRSVPGLKKKPSTSELIDWLKLLMADDMPEEVLKNRDPAQGHTAALRRAGQERAGRAPARAPGVHAPAREPPLVLRRRALQREDHDAGRLFHGSAQWRCSGLDPRIPRPARSAVQPRRVCGCRRVLLPEPRAAGEGREALRQVRSCVRTVFQVSSRRSMT